jgi:hypothetical protein
MMSTGCTHCGEDAVGAVLSTTGADTDATSSTTGGSEDGDESDGDGDGGGGGQALPCEMAGMFGTYESMLPTSEHIIEVDLHCDYSELIGDPGDPPNFDGSRQLPDDTEFEVYIYHPADSQGEWAESQDPFPVNFLIPGANLDVVPQQGSPDLSLPANHFYSHVVEPLMEMGVVTIAIQPSGDNWSSGQRKAALACTMIWAQEEWEEADRVGRSATTLGHSRGGSGVNILTQSFRCLEDPMAAGCSDPLFDLPTSTALDEYEICAQMGIASRWGDDTGQDATDTRIAITHAGVSPYLGFVGSIDQDTRGGELPTWDRRVDEDTTEPQNFFSQVGFDKLLYYVYGSEHIAWGGSFSGFGTLGVPQARAASAYYVEQFLRYQLFADMSAREELMIAMDPNAQTSAFPSSIQSVSWDAAPLNKFFDGDQQHGLEGLGRPLIYAEHTPGVLLPGASRLLVDNLVRTQGAQCGSETGTTVLDGSMSTLGGAVTVDAPGSATACQGAAGVLTDPVADATFDFHSTEAARVEWGDSAGGVTIEWSLRGDDGLMLPGVAQLHDYTHVELRIANVARHDATACTQATEDMDAFEVEVELVTEAPSGQEVAHSIGAGLSVEPEVRLLFVQNEWDCYGMQFLRTARIPLTDFCDQGEMSIGNFKAIRVRFPDDSTAHTALIDSIAFSRDPSAAQTPKCPKASGAWRCRAEATLAAVETSCSDITGLCRSSSPSHQEPVDLPFVDDGGIGYSGWVVHSPMGWVGSLDSPTQAELEHIKSGLCVKACLEEFASFPEIEINCEDSGVFETPSLLAANSVAPVRRVPLDRLDASGVFENQSLDCSIEDDCCEKFWSDVCPAKVQRASPAEAMLGRAEDFLLELSGSATKLVIETPSDSFVMPLVGTAGVSVGPPTAGSGGALVAPFYLGSLALESVQSVQLEDECPDQTEFELLVSSFEVELMQPAIGIGVLDQTFDAGFPAGALHARLRATIDGVPMTLRVVNPEDVITSLSPVFALSDLEVEFELPCGDDVLPVTAVLMFEHTDELGQPPQGGILSSPSVNCPNWLTLSHNITDADGDLDSVRWYVDDVLMAPSVVRIWVNDTHELKLVAKDERGATIERTLTIGCT